MSVQRLAAICAGELPVLLCLLMPTVGLVAGGGYAGMAGAGAVMSLLWWVARRQPPSIDWTLAVLAGLFAAWSWLSVTWSVAPAQSLKGAASITGIFVIGILYVAAPPPDERARRRMFGTAAVAIVIGSAVLCADWALGLPLQALTSARQSAIALTKYNRGVEYMVLLVPPVAAWLVREGRRRAAAVTIAAAVIAVVVDGAAAGYLALAGAGGAFLLGRWSPRGLGRGLAGVLIAVTVTLPLSLHAVTEARPLIQPWVKPSAVDRLEIWNYMTNRAAEAPLRGWGANAASRIPIAAEEARQYVYAGKREVYPHNQWLELWVETGLPGALLGLGFAVLMVWRIGALPPDLAPYGYASFTAAMLLSWVNFEVFTDSWWGALDACGWLFTVLTKGWRRA